MNKLNNLARKIDNCNTENQIVTQLVHKKMNETLVARSSETPRSTKTINIDDLQWADTLSLETIELLCRDN
ncbi:MAG: ATP-binding protein, partial [Clostridiales bacterium]|nr:ATP-binding protein [Clostridiales bacterium]